MLSIYILVYKLISYKNLKMVSTATYVNKSDTQYDWPTIVGMNSDRYWYLVASQIICVFFF